MKKLLYKVAGLMLIALPLAMTSCSDDYMEEINTDNTKTPEINPNAQLTTALLQTYGDFGMMDAYRCYVTGFTQYFAGGWNVSNYAGAVHADNDMMRPIWDELYSVSIKNLVDAIDKTADKPNLNAILRIHKVYLMSVITDTYGDVPYFEAGHAAVTATPKYDAQKDIYYDFFEELDKCIKQFDASKDLVTGDVSVFNGDVKSWMVYANSLRLRYAMRVSEVDKAKGQEEFEKAVNSGIGFIDSNAKNAYIRYIDGPFTLYDGARALDFRVNALGEMLYGQDSDSPTFVCATFFNMMKNTNDPRLYRICRHYLNPKRSAVKADDDWNVDVTDEVVAYENSPEGDLGEGKSYACNIGAAWWHNWVSAPSNDKIPTLEKLVQTYPEVGFDQSNYNARMMRPFLSIKFEKAECPGILMTAAEVSFLMAEAKVKGWDVDGTAEDYYKKGIREAMEMMNSYYNIPLITEQEITDYIAAQTLGTGEKAIENINTQAWIHHMMNPAEGWANLRRSGYPVLEDRYKYDRWPNDFTYDDENLTTPVRLKYPNLEAKYNKANYEAAIEKLGGTDDWHHRVWWDIAEDHVK